MIFRLLFAFAITFGTLFLASALNKRPTRTRVATATVVKAAPPQKKQEIRRKTKPVRKKLKNIKQAPRVSPNFTITMDIPLEMPQTKDMFTESLEHVDVIPPMPRADNPPPEYPQDARADGIQGRVVAMAHVDEYGFVSRTRILSSDPPGVFDSAVVTALRSWKFSPATIRGEPIDQWVEIPFNFVM